VIRVEVEHLPKPTTRANKTLWLWWSGEGEPDLDLCFRAYLRRFDIEHMFRFAKNTLGWTTPALRTPEQADRWSWLIVAALTQLRTGPRHRRRLATSLGTAPRPSSADPGAGPEGVSATSCSHRHPGQSTEIDDAWTPDGRRGPENRREPAIRQSKRQPEQASRV